MVDDHMPFESIAKLEQKLEWLRRRTTAHCADTSYHLEARSSGFVSVKPAQLPAARRPAGFAAPAQHNALESHAGRVKLMRARFVPAYRRSYP